MRSTVNWHTAQGLDPRCHAAQHLALTLMGVFLDRETPTATAGDRTIDAQKVSHTEKSAPLCLAPLTQWNRTKGGDLVGGREIEAEMRKVTPPLSISFSDAVVHGKAATVSGRFTCEDGRIHLFCHVFRFSDHAGTTVAHIVSFEREERTRPP